MGKKSRIIIRQGDKELSKWLNKTRHTKFQKRVRMLISLKKSETITQQEIADDIGADISTVQRWLKIYREFGIEKLCKSETRNKPSKLITDDILNWLGSILTNSSALAKGYKHIQVMIAEKFNKEIHYHALYYYLRKHFKTKLKTPRKSNGSKDQQAVDAFLKTA